MLVRMSRDNVGLADRVFIEVKRNRTALETKELPQATGGYAAENGIDRLVFLEVESLLHSRHRRDALAQAVIHVLAFGFNDDHDRRDEEIANGIGQSQSHRSR